MKRIVLTIALTLAVAATGLHAQETPKASLHLYSDQFGGSDGAVFYPQYAWNVKIPTGRMSGYGFGEVAPYEPFFTNHLIIYTPNFASWFSVHTEVGGAPNKGTHFVQIGPRINPIAIAPQLKKPMAFMFVTALPRFEGVRPNNLLVAGGTNTFVLNKNLGWHIESYIRIFPGGSYYNENWVLIHPKRTPHFLPGLFVLNDSSEKVSVGFGLRISAF